MADAKEQQKQVQPQEPPSKEENWQVKGKNKKPKTKESAERGKVPSKPGRRRYRKRKEAFGPDLWNAFYDGFLRVHLPEGVSLIGYADDVALTITGKDMQVTQERLNLVMRQINLWMGEHGL